MKIKNIAILSIGMLIGGTATYIYTKKKYEDILKSEIDSVKEHYKNRKELIVSEDNDTNIEEEPNESNKDICDVDEDNKIIDYKKISGRYINNTSPKDEYTSADSEYNDPYVIEPEEFGEDGYDTCTLTYYMDGVVVDDIDEIVDKEDLDEYIGENTLDVFDEYGASSVLVRNELFRMDYEIVKDSCKYSDLYTGMRDHEQISDTQKEKRPHEIE